MKCWAGWCTSWNQNYWEKYQQPQIWRWHHPYGRKQSRTKQPLDEGEREEWKSWLKTQNSKDKDHGIRSHHFRANRWGKDGNSVRFHVHGLQNHCRCWLQPWIKRCLLLWRIAMTILDSILKSRDITLPTKVCLVKAMVFPVVTYGWELDHKEVWVLKSWWFWTVVLEKTFESPLDWKDIKPVNPKRNQSWVFIGRTDTEAEAPVLCPPDVKSWLTGKDSAAGKIEGKRRRGQQRIDDWMAPLAQCTWVWANSGR